MEHRIRIKDGRAEFVYDDTLVRLGEVLGDMKVSRAGHVEPHPNGGWLADMRPSGGPILGDGNSHEPTDHSAGLPLDTMPVAMFGPVQRHMLTIYVRPFRTHKEAIAAERAWLREHRGL